MIAAQKLLLEGYSPYQANIIAFTLAFGVSYLGHFYVTFGGKARHASAFYRFAIISVGGFLLNNAVLTTLLEAFHLPASLALAAAILIVPLAVYVASHHWGFRAA